MPRLSTRTSATLLELLTLIVTVVLISWYLAPCHFTSIWFDFEFTGWVSPIANRLGDGVKLYSDQAHSPMAPLPYLVIHALSGGNANWYTENMAILVAQGVMVVILYCALARALPRPVPFLATFVSIPVYFSLMKTIFYDALPQALVALTALTAVAGLRLGREDPETEGDPHSGRLRPVTMLGPVAALAALATLAKQSTGIGVTLGVALMLTLLDSRPWRLRLVRPAAFLFLTLAMLVAFSLLISPWVDVQGMARDVFLTGSEPKGGVKRMIVNLGNYAGEAYAQVVLALAYVVVAFAFVRPKRIADPLATPTPESLARWEKFALPASLAAIAAPALFVIYGKLGNFKYTGITRHLEKVTTPVLWVGLLLLFATAARRLLRPGRPDRRRLPDWFTAMLLILLPAAVFHCLSTPVFRWTYDNNPLITVAAAGLWFALFGLLCGDARRKPVPKTWAVVAIAFVLSGTIWSAFAFRYLSARLCIEEWPEVAYLKGAKLRRSSDGMRELVATVKREAPDPRTDQVLLLPNDPNVEAWFDRPRPTVSSAILFTDQYWDRYVDGDFEAIVKARPKVIVVGPKNAWRDFHQQWHKHWGAERLLDKVVEELLPGRYTKRPAQKISVFFKEDSMDVYVRNDLPPALTASRPLEGAPGTGIRR